MFDIFGRSVCSRLNSPVRFSLAIIPLRRVEMKGTEVMAEEPDKQRVLDLQKSKAVRQLNDEWVKAFVARDAATLNRIMADDFIFTYPLEGDDKRQFIADVESGELTVEFMERDKVSVRVYGGTAVLSCRDTAKWFYKGRDFTGQYKTLHVYAEREGEWQLVAVQSCPYA